MIVGSTGVNGPNVRLRMEKKENHNRSVPCVALSLAASKWLCELGEIVLGLSIGLWLRLRPLG